MRPDTRRVMVRALLALGGSVIVANIAVFAIYFLLRAGFSLWR